MDIFEGVYLKEETDYTYNDEMDLVEIFAIILKRKWIIIIPTIIAFILSSIYVSFRIYVYSSKDNYKAEIIITPPQVYTIEQNYNLYPENAQIDNFAITVTEELSSQNVSKSYTFSVKAIEDNITTNKQININIVGQREVLVPVIMSIYMLFVEYEKKIDEKNIERFNLIQQSIKNALIWQKEMAKNFSLVFNGEALAKLPAGVENAFFYIISNFGVDILDMEIAKGLNNELELSRGSFSLVGNEKKEIIITKENIENIGIYLTPEKSRKRQLFPVIISVLLSFLISIFIAFVIEFFSRNDVKRRLRTIINKSSRK